jgi:nickel-dependent lactate racemase
MIQNIESNKKRILIITDDLTRTTPIKTLVPAVIESLKKGGAAEKNIRILIGNGLHRPMTESEIESHFGIEISQTIRIVNHNACEEKALAEVGTSFDGTKIKVNRLVLESDFIIAVGQIAPHRVAGFSGGSKMIQPAVCSKDITVSVHWRGWKTETGDIFGIRDNSTRKEMDHIAKITNLGFIVNVVLNPDNSIYGVFGGDYIKAHEKGCREALSIYSAKVKKADIVIVDSYPCDLDLWQAAKAATPAEMAMKEGGCVIMVTPCPEGGANMLPEADDMVYRPMSKIIEGVQDGTLKDLGTASHMSAFGRILEKGKLILVSPGFTREETLNMGFEYAVSVQEAFENEIKTRGKQSSVSILQQGGKLFPVL